MKLVKSQRRARPRKEKYVPVSLSLMHKARQLECKQMNIEVVMRAVQNFLVVLSMESFIANGKFFHDKSSGKKGNCRVELFNTHSTCQRYLALFCEGHPESKTKRKVRKK